VPKGPWYRTAGGSITEALATANRAKGYILIDSSSWIAARASAPDLTVLHRGGELLVNRYHALRTPPRPGTDDKLAERFVRFLDSADGQRIIAGFGRAPFGESQFGGPDSNGFSLLPFNTRPFGSPLRGWGEAPFGAQPYGL